MHFQSIGTGMAILAAIMAVLMLICWKLDCWKLDAADWMGVEGKVEGRRKNKKSIGRELGVNWIERTMSEKEGRNT